MSPYTRDAMVKAIINLDKLNKTGNTGEIRAARLALAAECEFVARRLRSLVERDDEATLPAPEGAK